jgi:alpha-mannosidase
LGQVTLDIDKGLEGAVTQKIIDIDGNEKTAAKVSIPSLGTKSYKLSAADNSNKSAFTYVGNTLETPLATVQFDENGAISSFVDKESGRELRRDGGAPLNTFYFAEDVPSMWDNWDIDPDVDMKLHPHMHLASREVVCDGTLQFRIKCEYNIGRKSKLVQHMVFYSDTKRVDFETKVDWHEKHRLLKVGFDIDVLSPTFRNEIQFGYLDRPTHMNTSWEAAKSEVCNHKWSDLSENRFGVAVLNDCKYGISCKGSDMRLSLHKGGCHPDPRGDEGLHYMTYSLLPHDGSFAVENVIRPSYELNVIPTVVKGKFDGSTLFTIDVPNVIVEAIKPAEDVDGYVVRMYECERSAVKSATLTFSKSPSVAYITNMLEEVEEQLDVKNNSIELTFRPFEIKTILIK